MPCSKTFIYGSSFHNQCENIIIFHPFLVASRVIFLVQNQMHRIVPTVMFISFGHLLSNGILSIYFWKHKYDIGYWLVMVQVSGF